MSGYYQILCRDLWDTKIYSKCDDDRPDICVRTPLPVLGAACTPSMLAGTSSGLCLGQLKNVGNHDKKIKNINLNIQPVLLCLRLVAVN